MRAEFVLGHTGAELCDGADDVGPEDVGQVVVEEEAFVAAVGVVRED